MHRTVQLTILAVALALFTLACGGGASVAGPDDQASFQGVWQGTWRRTACSETGATGVCAATPSTGVLRLTLSQTESTVQGTLEVGAVLVPVSGPVNANGTLTLSGQTHQLDATAILSNWSTSRSGSQMIGSFTITFVADNPAFGSQISQLTLESVTKTS